jgi:hypothetical protein
LTRYIKISRKNSGPGWRLSEETMILLDADDEAAYFETQIKPEGTWGG